MLLLQYNNIGTYCNTLISIQPVQHISIIVLLLLGILLYIIALCHILLFSHTLDSIIYFLLYLPGTQVHSVLQYLQYCNMAILARVNKYQLLLQYLIYRYCNIYCIPVAFATRVPVHTVPVPVSIYSSIDRYHMAIYCNMQYPIHVAYSTLQYLLIGICMAIAWPYCNIMLQYTWHGTGTPVHSSTCTSGTYSSVHLRQLAAIAIVLQFQFLLECTHAYVHVYMYRQHGACYRYCNTRSYCKMARTSTVRTRVRTRVPVACYLLEYTRVPVLSRQHAMAYCNIIAICMHGTTRRNHGIIHVPVKRQVYTRVEHVYREYQYIIHRLRCQYSSEFGRIDSMDWWPPHADCAVYVSVPSAGTSIPSTW